MIEKTIKRHNLKDLSVIEDELSFWLDKSSEERIATVEYLRRQMHGSATRLQRFVQVVQRS